MGTPLTIQTENVLIFLSALLGIVYALINAFRLSKVVKT